MKAEMKKISGGKIIKKVFAGFVFLGIFLLFSAADSSADVQEDIPHIAGVIEGTGTHFEVTDSEYLNIVLDSTEEITAKIESMPEMIILEIKSTEKELSANFTLSGFPADMTFHKYENDYHNHAPVITDDKGAFSFEVDLGRTDLIFIQPRKSTKFIKDNATGGDCAGIGSWDAAEKTCTLSQDVSETIQIDNNYITLDGNGHKITGTNTEIGINIPSTIKNITIKNATIVRFSRGILIGNYSTMNLLLNNNNISFNYYGIFSENYTASYGNNTYENNDISNNTVGMYIYATKYDVIKNNKVHDSIQYGMNLARGAYYTISGNILFGNEVNLVLPSSIEFGMEYIGTHNVDRSNLIEGKPLFFEKNIKNATYDSLDMGSFYCVNCDNITLKNISLPENKSEIFFWRVNNSLVDNATSPDHSARISTRYSSGNTIKNSDLGKISFQDSNNNQIYNNNFWSVSSPVSISYSDNNLFYLNPPIGGNYWKANEAKCKNENNDNFCDARYRISYSSMYDEYPLVKPFDFSQPSCCSSMMFLPGHQGSRLYRKDSGGGEDQLWEPTNHNEDVRELFLNSSGESINPDIYTKDIIDEGYGIKNIYENFIASMDQFTADGVIKEWKPIPYDWREPLEKIASDGVKLENGGHMDIIQEIRNMASASKTGKVTIVGHSNGGLLAKVLIDRLKESKDEKLVDKLIMVATPQLGTPKAIVSLLHGDDTNLLHGITLDKKTGREFGENMASAYNFLPTRKYFDIVQDPVVEFDEDVKEIYDFRSLYGENIDNWDEFKKFLLGDDGTRSEPEVSDLDSPNVLKENLLSQAEAIHDNLDDWQAPEGMEVVQIAGWGLDTVRGVKYDDCDIPFCPDKLSNLDRSLIMTQDGDETVVVPSAVEMGDNAEDYYLNVKEYNEKERIIINVKHAYIMEIEQLQSFIKNIIQNNKTLTEYITVEKPEVKDEDKRLRFRLHSPVKVDLYDEKGNHTGLVENLNPLSDLEFYEEQIPNSYYIESGEKKYAGTGDYTINIKLTGEDLGIFTFEIDQVAGDKVAKNTTFANIPTMKDMRAELAVSETVSAMEIDVDGDGQIDATIQAGEEVKKGEMLDIFQKIISSLDIAKTVKDRLTNKIDNALKQAEKGNSASANAMLENVKQQIETFSREQTPIKFRILKEEAEKLIKIIERIQAVE